MFECVNYIPINKNTCLGIATIRIPKWKMTITGFRLHQKEGKRWIQFPFRKTTDKEGKEIFPPNIWFDDRETKDKFCKFIIQAIEESAAKSETEEPLEETSFNNEEMPF